MKLLKKKANRESINDAFALATEKSSKFNSSTITFKMLEEDENVEMRLLLVKGEDYLSESYNVIYAPYARLLSKDTYKKSITCKMYQKHLKDLKAEYGEYKDIPREDFDMINKLKPNKSFLFNVYVVNAPDSFFEGNNIEDTPEGRVVVMALSEYQAKLMLEDINTADDEVIFSDFGESSDPAINYIVQRGEDNKITRGFIESEVLTVDEDMVFDTSKSLEELNTIYTEVDTETLDSVMAENYTEMFEEV